MPATVASYNNLLEQLQVEEDREYTHTQSDDDGQTVLERSDGTHERKLQQKTSV